MENPMNHSAKFDASSFILGREIRNHAHKQTKNTQTVNDISKSPCLSACVDNEQVQQAKQPI